MPDTVTEFLHMGGYAFFVWWSYAVVLVVLVLNLVAPTLKIRRVRRALARDVRAAEAAHHEP